MCNLGNQQREEKSACRTFNSSRYTAKLSAHICSEKIVYSICFTQFLCYACKAIAIQGVQ